MSVDQRMGDAPWLADPELRPDWVPFDSWSSASTISARFDDAAARHSASTALIGPEGSLTYAEAAATVHRAAHAVQEVVTGPRSVALLLDHGPDLVLAVLGVMAAGGIVLVLDPLAPDDLNRAVLADADAAALVSDSGHQDQAERLAAETIRCLGWPDLAAGEHDPGSPAPVDDDAPAMLAYTSGSTGRPKAAVLSHRALLHVMRGATDSLAISASDRLPMIFPPSLAVAAYPMFLPLMNGGALCTFDLRSLGLAGFPAWLVEQAVSVLYFSPTVARFMGDASTMPAFPSLRLVVLGGERVDGDAVHVVRDIFGSRVVVANGYGATETGVLTFYFTRPGEQFGPEGVPVGRAIEGMELFLDGGELHVRSRYLFSGYWRQPEVTARVLEPPGPDGRAVYRTGDLASLADDGCLSLGGRYDTEVKVRGHRVVPGEVEQALLALAEVQDAVVDGRADPMEGTSLVAWVVPATGSMRSGDIRTALAATVKPYMVPSEILMLDELPQLPNGKLDRRALPEPDGWRPIAASEVTAPRNELERELVELWESVLEVRPVGVRDSFADLGGHSLDLARILVRLEEEHQVVVPMSDMLHVRTVEDLAEVVDARRREAGGRQSTVVEVKAGSAARPPLFFVHDLYGSAFVLRFLAPELDADQPLFGFESPLLRGPKSPFRTLELLALRYVADLRAAQPEGPYCLAGYSFGGVLAYEMARQLVADGQEVAFLGVIDVGPGYRGRHYNPHRVLDKPWLAVPGRPDPSLGAVARLGYYRDMVRREPSAAVEHVLLRTGLDRWSDPLLFRRDLHRDGRIHPGRRLAYSWRLHWRLARDYDWDQHPYAGDMTLFWADESASTDATMGWASVVSGTIDVVRVPISHEAILQEQSVGTVGPLLQATLDSAIARRSEP